MLATSKKGHDKEIPPNGAPNTEVTPPEKGKTLQLIELTKNVSTRLIRGHFVGPRKGFKTKRRGGSKRAVISNRATPPVSFGRGRTQKI